LDGRDELSDIPGIGTARARWLKTAFDVQSFADLAALSPDEVERRLKSEGRGSVSRSAIEGWISEAKARTAVESEALRTKHQDKGKTPSSGSQSDWKPVASFVVEFQTRDGDGDHQLRRTAVHYLEEDRNEHWTGFDWEKLAAWMRGQLRREAAAPQPDEGEVAVAPLDLDVVVVDGDGARDSRLIRIDKPWTTIFRWSQPEAQAMHELDWQLDLLLKRVDAGEPRRLRAGPVHVSADAARTEQGYEYRLEVSSGFAAPHVNAACRVSATTAGRSKGDGRLLYTGVAELGLLYFYEPARESKYGTLAIEDPAAQHV